MPTKIIKHFIGEFFPKAANILLFGSCIKSKQPNDFDLMILSSDVSSFTREVFSYKKQVFETIIVPKNKIYSIIELDKEYGIYISIINEGEILKDKDGELKHIKNLIRTRLLKPSPILRKYNIEYELSENFKYLKSSQNKEHRELLFNSIIEGLIDLNLLNWGIISAKKTNHKFKEISKVAPQFLSQLSTVKNSYFIDLHWEKLIKSLDTLVPINNILNTFFFSNQYFLNEVYNDELVVHIDTKGAPQELILENLITPLFDSIPISDYYFFEIKKQSLSLLEKGFYLVIRKEKKVLKNLILEFDDFLNNKKPKNFSVSEFTYPYQLNLSNFFGVFDFEEYKKLTHILQSVSKFVKENYIKKEISVLWYLNILFGSYIESGIKREAFIEDFKEFGTFLGHSFIKGGSEENLIKNRMLTKSIIKFNKDSMVTNVILKTHTNVCKNWKLKDLPESKVNILLESVKIDTIKKRNLLFYFLSKVFLIDPTHLVYIFYNIGLLLENEYED